MSQLWAMVLIPAASDHRLWTHYFQFKFVRPDGVPRGTDWVAPTAVVHLLEHWLIAVFHIHAEGEGGLNVNILDRFCFDFKLSAAGVRNLLRVLNRVCTEEPNTVLPNSMDQKAWEFFLSPMFTPLPIVSVRLSLICRFLYRQYHGQRVDTSACAKVLYKPHRLRPVPASESNVTSLVKNAAYRELELLRDNVAAAKAWVKTQGQWEEE